MNRFQVNKQFKAPDEANIMIGLEASRENTSAFADEGLPVSAGQGEPFPRKRPAGPALDTYGILLINKANTASVGRAHRVLTNTTGIGGGMAEAIIPNLCPWWIPPRGFLFKLPGKTNRKEKVK